MKQWCVYILELNNGAYYTGITNDLPARIKMHRSGKGSKCVRGNLPCRVVFVVFVENKSVALKREIEIKKMKRRDKEKLVVEFGGDYE
jgi:putative endonuclease